MCCKYVATRTTLCIVSSMISLFNGYCIACIAGYSRLLPFTYNCLFKTCTMWQKMFTVSNHVTCSLKWKMNWSKLTTSHIYISNRKRGLYICSRTADNLLNRTSKGAMTMICSNDNKEAFDANLQNFRTLKLYKKNLENQYSLKTGERGEDIAEQSSTNETVLSRILSVCSQFLLKNCSFMAVRKIFSMFNNFCLE